MFLSKGIRLWKNEILHKLARNAVIIVPAPLSARLLRPLIHKWRGVKMGKNVFIGIEVMFDSVYPERIHIGDGCIITNRVQILAHNRDLSNYKKGDKIRNKGYIVKDVVIENEVVLGIESIILPGVTIGEGAVVAAGALVTKDVAPYTMVAGVPAKEIRKF
jgi:acetyltransferase-like isoleucine patch superfamily enzyme